MPKGTVSPGHSAGGEGFDGHVVGIGASAGGLEALEIFFDHCPADSGAAFVVIQHLSPDHKSMMRSLLARRTTMPVQVAEDGMPLAANAIFLIPPGQILRIEAGHLKLEPKPAHGLVLPIDLFLYSLAHTFGARAVGIILSGTGSDGTRGAAEINAAGGLMLAQNPREARFDGMPSSVIGAGVVDDVLAAAELPARVLLHLGDPGQIERIRLRDASPVQNESAEQAFDGILQLLREVGGIDFSQYKSSTVARRIERRMQLRRASTFARYLDLLRDDRGEISTLRRELLIPVTSFFRDESAFELIDSAVVRKITQDAVQGEVIRVWVAGCSTGEEAYSLAMLFLEQFDRLGRRPELKIFATDVSEQSIELAAAGQYPDAAGAEIPRSRLERFFVRSGNSYVVTSELRQCIVFARHNLLADPPFTRMNLVSCRNTLIYFRRDAQLQALKRLQYALRPGGFLFLGPSESIAGHEDAFETLDARHKIYQRTTLKVPAAFSVDVKRAYHAGRARPPERPPLEQRRSREASLIDQGLHQLLEAYAPPSILVNDKHEAIHLFGDLQPYVCLRHGSASLELNRILAEPLVPVASALLFKAAKDGKPMMSSPLQITPTEGPAVAVQLRVRPVEQAGDERFLLLSIEAVQPASTGRSETVDVDLETRARMEMLEQELAATRESLQSTIEELETSNEELQATNEELMASNEELQSSNEELQSVNEELNTVNAEYQEKVMILNRLNADLDGMEKAVGIATVFVDEELHLTRYSPDAVDLFKLREGDIGRPLDDIAHRIHHSRLMEDIRHTLRTERPVERELMTDDGQSLLMRIMPYRVLSVSRPGAVASFVDVTAVKGLQRLQATIDALSEHIAVLDADGTIVMVNEAWRRFARTNGDVELLATGPGSNYLNVCAAPAAETDPLAVRARAGLKGVLEGSREAFSLRYPCHSPDEKRWFIMNVAPIRSGPYSAVVSHLNITPWYRPQDDSEATDD